MTKRARRWCDYCEAAVPAEKSRGWTYGGWTCLRCERSTYPLWAVKTARNVGAALGWISAWQALGAVIGLALGILIGVTTDVPLAPGGGLVLGALIGWLLLRGRG
jgi:hypothetical protein